MYFTNWAIIPFLIMLILLIIALPSFFAFLFIVWVTRRLNRLNQAMRSLDLSGEPVFLHDGSKDEIGALTSLYNEMAGKLHDQYRRIRQIEQARSNLVSQLSHDLRTPLSVIKGYAETLQRGSAHDRETRLRHATIILQKSDYMNELLRKLFRLAQLDDPAQAFEKKEGHLDSLLQTIMADYVLILQDKGIAWQMEMPESPVAMTFNRDGLTQLFRNLIDNAILHGGDGKYLGIRLKREGPSVHIEIEDRGKGIPDHQLNRVFDPFYRINQGRPGNGLGIGQAGGIMKAAARKLASGYPDGTFQPNRAITWAEFTVMLANALNLQGAGAPLAFTDNGRIGEWAKPAVARAVEQGFVRGYADGSFRPDAPVTRAEMAVMIAGALGRVAEGAATTPFADDAGIPAWAKGAAHGLAEAGIMSGKAGNRFAPQDQATRAEAAVLLVRILERLERGF